MENTFSEKESFELISQMIHSAKNNLQKGSGRIFLLWGYLVAIISLVNLLFLFILPQDISYYSYYIWFLMAGGIFFHFRFVKQYNAQQKVKTYVDRVLDFVWIAFSISIFTLIAGMLLISLLNTFHKTEGLFGIFEWIHWAFLVPSMLILYGFALFVSGKAYQFRPLVTGAVVCWASTIALCAFYRSGYYMEIQLVALMISAIAGYIVPGHLLTAKEKSNV